jgi:hypothetical protein
MFATFLYFQILAMSSISVITVITLVPDGHSRQSSEGSEL